MLRIMTSLWRNMCGYLIGLSSPSVTEAITTLDRSPRSKRRRADEVAHVFDQDDRIRRRVELLQALGQHDGVEVAARAGVDLDDMAARRPDAFGVIDRLLIAFDDRKSQLASQVADRAFQQRRLARARGTHQVQGENVAAGEPAPVALRQAVVLGENVRFQTDGRSVRVRVPIAGIPVIMAVA